MRNFTKILLALALTVVCVGGAKAGNHYLEITTNSAKTNSWDWQFWYDLSESLVVDETYVLTMDAKCSQAFHLDFWPYNTSSGCIYKGYDLSTSWQSYTCEFTATCAVNRIRWCFGTLNGSLFFDNIKLYKKGHYDVDLLSNGDFESGSISPWAFTEGLTSSLYETDAVPTRYFKMTNNTIKTNQYESAVKYNLDEPLVAGKTYKLTMMAKCTESHHLCFWPAGDGTTYTGYSVGTEWDDCECTFEAAGNLTYLQWVIGDLAGTVWFKDISLVEQGTTENLIKNGNLENALNWSDFGYHVPDFYGIVLEYPAAEAIVPIPEFDLVSSFYNNSGSCAVNVSNEAQGAGSLIYGDVNVHYSNYADLSLYSGIKLYGSGGTVRIMYNRPSGEGNGGTCPELVVSPTAEGTLVDISSYQPFHLNAIKVNWGQTATITKISVIDPNAPTDVDYVLSGDIKDGAASASIIAALADADAKVIDVTGVTGSGMELVSANPNCLFVANAGTLTNDHNVVVGSACAKLELTDGYPFKAPAVFTATAAPTYNRAFTADKITTVCLPFALTETEAATLGTFYELTSFDGATLHFTAVAAPEANKAYLVKTDATGLTLSEDDKDIVATPADLGTAITDVDFIGTLAATSIPASDATDSYYAYNNGALVKIVTNPATLPAFRGYFKVSTSTPAITAARELNLSFDDNETTGISQMETVRIVDNADIFDLQGRRVAQPTKGLYIVNGKKVIIK
ncbi:MAG: hypothetical protein J6T05_07205 [Prevotella sp.]|nr:hypothetical protein [Prevotella sp.]